jgi:hypothetical protein
MLALVQQNMFEIYKVTLVVRKWNFKLQCPKFRFGSPRPPTSAAPWRILAAMSDRVLCLALPEKCIKVYDLQGHLLGTIRLSDQCRIIVMSRCGQFVLVATGVGVYLYDAGRDGTFGLTTNLAAVDDSAIVTRLLKPDNYWDDKGVANCMAFCPNSRQFSFCTRENIVHTYRIEEGSRQPILLYKFNRKLERMNLSEPYFGITGLALYHLILILTYGSSADSNRLLVVADAKGDSCPIIIHKQDGRYSVVPMISAKYKHKNKYQICSATFSPAFFGALLLFRDGTVKFANWSQGTDQLLEVADGERLEEETNRIRGSSSMAFSEDGMNALAVDREGKVLALRFSKVPTRRPG